MARMSWYEACQLDPSLTSLTHIFRETPEVAQTLTGGLTNRCWKIEFPGQPPVVWRPATDVTQAFSISRHQEYHILSALKERAVLISPEPLHINEHGLLVQWIDGVRVIENDVEMMTRLLSQIHQFPVTRLPIIPFIYTARIDHYWFKLQSMSVELGDVEPLYKIWRTLPNIPEVPISLCHFDLGSHNLIRTAQGVKVIDWEYAALADPRIDLAMTIYMADTNLVTAVGQYCQHRNITDIDAWIDGVKSWMPRVKMLAMLWYLIAYQLWENDVMIAEAERIKEQLNG
ncbi:phosphotransferase [Vibrio mangrovi]|uniref:Phosphotransferase n=1 Tax=Vibrio mangrovi TaxID=474394 RepID=A0A1Y6IRV5_9VIBR|nr:phosphotransferase [Vibrio mangrovi]MDW6003678.1 phosphotransferase [Vibrio mangrovi]SMR99530.1 Thiamine kinase [Vibrio mangrovi]